RLAPRRVGSPPRRGYLAHPARARLPRGRGPGGGPPAAARLVRRDARPRAENGRKPRLRGRRRCTCHDPWRGGALKEDMDAASTLRATPAGSPASVAPAIPPSFEALFRREYARVVGIALRIVRDADEAEDVAQDVFI